MKNLLNRLIILILIIFVVFFNGCQKNNTLEKKQPLAANGVLDLTNWDLKKDGLVKLKGEWQFYWEHLLQPDDFHKEAGSIRYIEIPGSWNGYKIDGKELSGNGYATFRLKIIGVKKGVHALKIPTVATAYRIWINGELISSNGIVGKSREEMTPQYLPQVVSFNDNGEIELIMQVSNFMHRRGGIWENIFFGTTEQINGLRDKHLGYQMFLLGSLLVMGLHHLLQYLFRRKEKSSLYFGIASLLMAIRNILIGEVLLIQFFPLLNWELTLKIEYLTYYLGIILFVMFFKSLYPKEIAESLYKLVIVLGLSFAAIVVFFPAYVYTSLNFIYQIFTIFIGFYILYIFIKLYLQKRENCFIAITGFIILLITIINDILYFNEVILTGNLSSFGLLVFVIAQSFLLSVKYSKAFTNAEELAQENALMLRKIKELNSSLEEKIMERTKKLNEIIDKLNCEIEERKEVEEKLRIYATTDIMTGVLNRATGLTYLNKQLSLAERNKCTLTICFVDINDLKMVNDNLGHQQGDELIISLSKIILENIRTSDTVSRLGGDEFLIIFPNCSKNEAESILHRITKQIEEHNKITNRTYCVSISHGFAEYKPGVTLLSMDELIEMADAKMYELKKERKKLPYNTKLN